MSQTLETPTSKQLDSLTMERERLLRSTRQFKSALEGQVDDLKESAVRWSVQGLIFGGVALGSYLLVRAFRGKAKEQQPESGIAKTSFASTIFASIQSYILSFLLSMAREKITAYLENYFLQQNAGSRKDTAIQES